jgi:endonuclease/exonuclease/phosphatase family metal-dependent hydrolase
VAVPEPLGAVTFVHHFPSWQPDAESKREVQTLRAAEAIDEFRANGKGHVIVAGDLDANLEAASLRFWTGRQSLDGRSTCYRDAFEAAGDGDGDTFVPSNPLVADHDWPFRRIDHILVRCGQHGGPTLEIRSCRRVFAEPVDGVWASDHFGVLADLALPEPVTWTSGGSPGQTSRAGPGRSL